MSSKFKVGDYIYFNNGRGMEEFLIILLDNSLTLGDYYGVRSTADNSSHRRKTKDLDLIAIPSPYTGLSPYLGSAAQPQQASAGANVVVPQTRFKIGDVIACDGYVYDVVAIDFHLAVYVLRGMGTPSSTIALSIPYVDGHAVRSVTGAPVSAAVGQQLLGDGESFFSISASDYYGVNKGITIFIKKCECGCSAVGSFNHSTWCPMYEKC